MRPRAMALGLAAVNLVLGLGGLFAPFVVGGSPGLVNLDNGRLFALVATNWAHAGVHVAFGAYGLAARRSEEGVVTFSWSVAVVFGLLALLGFLGQAGVLEVRGPEGTLVVFEIAVDTAANLLHLLFAGVGAAMIWDHRGAQREDRSAEAAAHRRGADGSRTEGRAGEVAA